jgi:flagellar hook-basal body complex protein FliE
MSDISGIKIYNKILEANKSIKASAFDNAVKKQMNVLRQGDNLEVVANNNTTPTQSFADIVSTLVQQSTNKITAASKVVDIALNDPNNKVDSMQIMAAINDAQIALDEIIAIRDKFIDAYKTILNMPV